MAKQQKTIWVISGTHWDREWRFTADQSLVRLRDLMDDLLEILEQHPEFTCFHLDGGTVVMEDYLAVRPENAERLKKLMRDGRVVSVPWYTLPEMNIVAPEALVRNLLVGKRTADQVGGTMRAGYTATSYGQISQMPQIYDGFNLSSMLTYRGTNKHQVPPISLWEAPDGTRIPLIRCFDEVTRTNWFYFVHYELVLDKLPRDLRVKFDALNMPVHMADEVMYETAWQMLHEPLDINTDPQAIDTALSHFVEQASPQAIGPHLLGLDMEDNAVPFKNLPKLIDAINAHQDAYQAVLAPLDDYVDAVLEQVRKKKLPVVQGELRYAAIEAGFNGLLGGVGSSQIQLKLLNHAAETELIHVAEPLCAMAAMSGMEYPVTLLDRAWLKLLQSHAHDSICGAAISEAHEQMPARFYDTIILARDTSRKAAEHLWARLDTVSKFAEGDITITLFNPHPFARKGVVPVVLDVPISDTGNLYFDRDTGLGPLHQGVNIDELITYTYFDIVDEEGKAIDWERLEKETIKIEVERKLDSNSISYYLDRHRMLMDVEVPPMGYRTYALHPRKRRYNPDPQPKGDRGLIAGPDGTLENKHLHVRINPNGTFDLTDKKRKRTIPGMHFFTDNGSTGDGHFVIMPKRDHVVTSLASQANVSLMENNPMRATWRIDLTLEVPAEVDEQGRNRSPYTVEVLVSTWVTLRRGARRLEMRTRIDNTARDHRLRVNFPTDIDTDTVDVESAFDVVNRSFQWKDTAENHEGHFPWQPMLHFVDVSEDKHGLAFMSKGLREYEVIDDARRTLAVPLVRAHRAYMRANKGPLHPEEIAKNRRQHAEGVHDVEYALYPHDGDWRKGEVLNESRDYITPWRIIEGTVRKGDLPVTQSCVTLSKSEHVHLGAFCRADNGDGYILRIWNSADEELSTKLRTTLDVQSVTKVKMNETTELDSIEKKDGAWKVGLRPKEIATLLLKP